eukprot:SAG31_NODE_18373_length_638_cov_1.727273_1_plen_149_part_00
MSRYADRSSVIKAVAGSLNESERAAIAMVNSFGVDSAVSYNQGVCFDGLRALCQRMIDWFGLPIRLFEVRDSNDLNPWAGASRLQDPEHARCIACYLRSKEVSTAASGLKLYEVPVRCIGCQFFMHPSCSEGNLTFERWGASAATTSS